MIIRIVNSVDSAEPWGTSFSIASYMALHVMTFVAIGFTNRTMHAENSDIFNKYNRMQQIMIIVVASCSYPIVLIKFVQCLLGVWIINYTIFFLHLAILIFRCQTLGFTLHPEIVLDVASPADYNLINRLLLALIMLWFITLEYSIKIDTNLPKRVWMKWIHRPVRSLWLKLRDIPAVVVNTVKKDTESDIVSISSSLPSYRTEELPSYNANAVQLNLPPLYEEANNAVTGINNYSSEQMTTVPLNRAEGSPNRANDNDSPEKQYTVVFKEITILFLWFSVEYKRPIRTDGVNSLTV